LLVFHRNLVRKLQWDPWEWRWFDPLASSKADIRFFEYASKLGRSISAVSRFVSIGCNKDMEGKWLDFSPFLKQFWVRTSPDPWAIVAWSQLSLQAASFYAASSTNVAADELRSLYNFFCDLFRHPFKCGKEGSNNNFLE
jgi:hypothetical protein